MKSKKDREGLYFHGELVAETQADALLRLYGQDTIIEGYKIRPGEPAPGYSVVDAVGVQHIYDLSAVDFFNALANLD